MVATSAASALLVWVVASLLLDAEVTVPESQGSDLRHALETPAVVGTAIVALAAPLIVGMRGPRRAGLRP